MKIVLETFVVLRPADQRPDFLVESLYAHLELKGTGGKSRDDFTQRLRQPIGNHFKVIKHSGPMAVQKELKQRAAHTHVQIKCPVHELELADSARDELLQVRHQRVERELPHWNIQRGQTEFALKRTATRSLDVNEAVGNIRVVIERVRQGQPRQVGQ